MRKITALLYLLAMVWAARAQTAQEILDRMDDAMVFPEGVMSITIEDRKPDGTVRVIEAKVRYALDAGTLVEFTVPERERGKRILMVGDTMWMGTPKISKPVRLSGKDFFMGTSFTNDDVMNFDKSDDYIPAILAANGRGWTLELWAKRKNLPYPRVVVVVDKDFIPLTMKLYVASGVEAKHIEYSNQQVFGGKLRPATMTIVDSMTGGGGTTIRFESMEPGKVDRALLTPSGFMK